MNLTKPIEYKNIKDQLNKKDSIALISCNNCVRVAGTSNVDKMKELALRLREDGYNVIEGNIVTLACVEPYLKTVRISYKVDTVIVLACCAGWSNIKRNFPNLKLVKSLYSMGPMVGDMEKGVIKLLMPYKAYADQKGNEFKMLKGTPMPTRQINI